jgi:hypothetical protein
MAAPEMQAGGEWLNFTTVQGARTDSPYNPGNNLAGLPNTRFESVLRGNFRLNAAPFLIAIGPRLTWRLDRGTNDASTNTRHEEAYVQSWQLEYRNGAVDLFYNRELLLWGPSLFASPSNPFFRDTNQVNPFMELPSRDFVGGRWRLTDSSQLNLLVNVDDGRDSEVLRPFEKIAALQFEHRGYDYSLGAVVANRQDKWRGGLYGQHTLGESVVLYADGAWFQGSDRLIAHQQGNDWTLATRADKNYADLLIGSAYTFDGGITVNAELRHNSEGYDAAERRAMARYAQFHADRFTGSDPSAIASSAQALGAVVQPHASTFGRNYLLLQYNDQQIADRTSLVMQWSYGIDTRESSVTAVISHDAADRIRLLANLNAFTGGGSSEYHKYLDYAIFAGAKIFF